MMETYTHTQSSPATTWTIDHNLGRYPIVDVVIDFGGSTQQVQPKSIVSTSTNQVVVTFTTAHSGTARLA